MATDPKKDQEDQPEQLRRNATAGKSAELTDEQLKDLAGGNDPGRVPVKPDDPLYAKKDS